MTEINHSTRQANDVPGRVPVDFTRPSIGSHFAVLTDLPLSEPLS